MATIRLAQEKDLPAMLEIYRPYILHSAVSFEYTVPSLKEFSQRYALITGQFPWLVCEIDGAVAGYAYASRAFERAAYQWDADISVYVQAEFQRRGIAASFYRCIGQILQLQGYCLAYAIVTGGNEKSRAFHEAMGFRQCGMFRRAGYKLGGWHDVIWYEKKLREFPQSPEPPASFPQLDRNAVAAILRTPSEVKQS